MLLRLVCPLTAGMTYAPMPPLAPPEFCSGFAALTPGVSKSNSVKLRPFKGRSFTSLV